MNIFNFSLKAIVNRELDVPVIYATTHYARVDSNVFVPCTKAGKGVASAYQVARSDQRKLSNLCEHSVWTFPLATANQIASLENIAQATLAALYPTETHASGKASEKFTCTQEQAISALTELFGNPS